MNASELKMYCTSAHQQFAGNCSGAVRYVSQQMGYILPPLTANQLVDYFDNTNNGWSIVSENEAQLAADRGKLVIAGKKELPNGHVVVVMPGGKGISGGYNYTDKKGLVAKAADHGSFPRSCSTAQSNWPGAVSQGERTVFDAWGSIKNYHGVKYWLAPAKLFDFSKTNPGDELSTRVPLLKGRKWEVPGTTLNIDLPVGRPFVVCGVQVIEKWMDVEAKLDVPVKLRVTAQEAAAVFKLL